MNQTETIGGYKKLANDCRKKVVEMLFKAQSCHLGSNMSAIDLLAVLFENVDIEKDKFVCSPGWKAASIYYFLAHRGVIPKEDLETFYQDGSKYIGLIEPMGIWGAEFAGGSVGMGLPAGVGFSLAKKTKKEDGKVYILESDGAMDVGLVWESALIASHHKLNNLVLIIDANGFQAMDKKSDVLNIEPLKEKFEAFGWETKEINGHNFESIELALQEAGTSDKPFAIIARTIKGWPLSFANNNNDWHYRNLDKEHYDQAIKELSNA